MGDVVEMDGYATHLPLLARSVLELAKRKGLIYVYELGVGHYSTPLIRAIVRSVGGVHFALEKNRWWAKQVQDQWKIEVGLVDSWDIDIPSRESNLFFLDNDMLTSDRARMVPGLVRRGAAVVLHDADSAHIQAAINEFPFHYFDSRCTPWTAIVSDKEDVQSWFDGGQ